MCRISGLFNSAMEITAIETIVNEMCCIQQHGGPDDMGIYSNDVHHLVLGHRRLSLIDLSTGGHQPMAYQQKRYYISYNGELYNYQEIKATLIKDGYRFKNTSDTEVILAAFAAWGVAAFKKFNGMFAFALWDNETSYIYLVRDAAGIKPLYFAHTPEGLAFASEIKAFKPIPYLQEPHLNWQVYLMAYGHLPEPITTLKQVCPLKKGHYFSLHLPTGKHQLVCFSRYSYVEHLDNRELVIDKIKSTLSASVKRHLLADATVGVFLSGGIDSSIMACLANKYHPNISSISLIFDDPNFSEKRYQDLVQQTLKGNHHQQLLQESSFHQNFEGILKSMDLPSCDGLNTWFISKLAKEQGLKAVLSGLGGDELYGGYPSFKRIQLVLGLQQLPASLLRAATTKAPKKFRRICYLSIAGGIGRYLFLRGQFIPSEVAEYLGAYETEVWRILEEQPHAPSIDHLTPKNQASWLETNMYMQNQLLRDADAMSMAHGVEIRTPFLDHEFYKLSLQICSATKYNGAFQKQLLIDSFKDILPEHVWNRPKMGFAFPFKNWLMKDHYASTTISKMNSNNHQRFLAGDLHWSQFFTMYLMENYKNA